MAKQAGFATLLLAGLVGCVAQQMSALPTSLSANVAKAGAASDVATGNVTLEISIKVPPHQKLRGRPHAISMDDPSWVSPGTEGLLIALFDRTTHKIAGKPFFFALTKKTKGCSGGSFGTATEKPTALRCSFSETVKSGTYDAKLVGYSLPRVAKSPIIERATIPLKLNKPKNAMRVSLGGQARYLVIQILDANPPSGVAAGVNVRVLAADDWSFFIFGKYDTPLTLGDSDTTGATKLSATTLTSSTIARDVTLSYNGAALKNVAVISVSSTSTPHKAAAVFSPGTAALEAYPDGLFIATPAQVTIVGVGEGIVPPFSASTTADRLGNPACSGIVSVSGASPTFTVTPLSLGTCALVFSDRGGHTLSVPVLVQSEPGSPGDPTPGPSPSPSGAPTASPSPSAPPNGVSASPATVTLCPSSGTNACASDSASLQISQPGFNGSFTENDTCAGGLAAVTPVSAGGPTASYTIAGGSTLGQCTATFTGAGALQTVVTIDITQSGWIINTRHTTHTTRGQ